MKVENFVKEYNESKNKEKYLSECAGRKYVPYEEKIARCKNIADNTMYKNVEGIDKSIYSINTPARYVLHTLTLIDLYTEIEIDFTNTIKDFNLLDSEGLIPVVLEIVPQNELNRFSQVLDWIVSDKIENERSVTSFLENKFDAFELTFGTMFNAIEEVANNKEIIENITNKLS